VELFSIQCTTCRAHLKVKDAAIIGSILNCPKCSSMVQVVPPVGWTRPGSEAAAAASDTSGLTEPSAPAVSTDPVATPAASPAPARAAVSAPPALQSGRATEGSASDASPAVESPPEAAMTLHPDPTPPNVAWGAGLLAHAKRDWPMVSGGLAAGVVLGASMWFALGLGSDPPQSAAVARSRAEIATARPEGLDTESGPAMEPQPARPTDPDPALAAEPPGAQRIVETSAQPGAVVADVEPPATTVAEAPQVVSTAADSPAPKSPVTAAPSVEPESETKQAAKPSIKLDPDPSRPGPTNPFDLSAPGVAAPASIGESPDEPPTDDAPASNGGNDQPHLETLSEEVVEDRMSVMLGEVNFVGVPLGQFVGFVADLTTLSIVIDDAALAAAGKKRSMPVTVRLNDTTVQEALGAALAPLGLTYQVRGNRLFITVAERGTSAGR
jgi:hypothetical protein